MWATPQKPKFLHLKLCASIRTYYLLIQQMAVSAWCNFALEVLWGHWWGVSSSPPAQDWGMPPFSMNFLCRTPSVVVFLRAGEESCVPVAQLLSGCEKNLHSSISADVSLLSCSSQGGARHVLSVPGWHLCCSITGGMSPAEVHWLLIVVSGTTCSACKCSLCKGVGKAGGNRQWCSIKQKLPWIYVISCKDYLKSFECQLRSGACLPYGVFPHAAPPFGKEEERSLLGLLCSVFTLNQKWSSVSDVKCQVLCLLSFSHIWAGKESLFATCLASRYHQQSRALTLRSTYLVLMQA